MEQFWQNIIIQYDKVSGRPNQTMMHKKNTGYPKSVTHGVHSKTETDEHSALSLEELSSQALKSQSFKPGSQAIFGFS